MSEQNPDNYEQYRQAFNAAKITLEPCDNVPFMWWDGTQRKGVLKSVEGYKLFVNGQDTGLFIHNQHVDHAGNLVKDDWGVTLPSGLFAVQFFNVTLSSRKKAIAMAYAFHMELCRVGIPVEQRNAATLNNGKKRHKELLKIKKSQIYAGYMLLTDPAFTPELLD